MNETAWRFMEENSMSSDRHGAREVMGFSDAQFKLSFTSFATCTISGDKLKHWVIAQGKTDDCHQRFGEIEHEEQLGIAYSPSGWVNTMFLFWNGFPSK